MKIVYIANSTIPSTSANSVHVIMVLILLEIKKLKRMNLISME